MSDRRDVLGGIWAAMADGQRLVAAVLAPFGVSSRVRRDGVAPAVIEVPIPSLPEGWQVVSYAVLSDGSLGLLGADVDLKHEWRGFPYGPPQGDPHGAAARAQGRIWTFDGKALEVGPTFPLLTPFPQFDRFPDGRWLVAGSRTGDEPNARILAVDGSEIGRIRLGDGIQHLKIDSASRIWVGWFDEGVLGNPEWRVPGQAWPPSSAGLAAFTDTGAIVTQAEGAPKGSEIADCYALNVVGDAPWACTYMDFPLSTWTSGTGWRWWRTKLSGPSALAVRTPWILVAGGYGEDRNRVELIRIDGRRVVSRGVWRLPMPVEVPPAIDLFDGRGEQLHAVWEGVWRRWPIDAFLEGVRAA